MNRVADDDYKYLGWAVKVVVPEKTGRLVIETTGWEADWMDDAIKDGSLPEVVDANDYIGIICEEYGPTNNFGVGGHKWINSVDNHDCTWSGTDDTPQDDFALGIKIVETKRWAASGLAPVADAGPDRTVCVGERVTLDGRRSIDREGGALTSYFWRQVSGPTMLLPSPTNAVTSFWAPSSGPAIGSARVTFELKVTTSTTSSDTDTVTFVIKPASTCKLPEFARPPLLGEIR